MVSPIRQGMRRHAMDEPVRNEVVQRDNQPTGGQVRAVSKGGTGSFVKPDGINAAIPATNNTKAPGQWGKS